MLGSYTLRFAPIDSDQTFGFPFDKEWMQPVHAHEVPHTRDDKRGDPLPPVQLVIQPMLVVSGLDGLNLYPYRHLPVTVLIPGQGQMKWRPLLAVLQETGSRWRTNNTSLHTIPSMMPTAHSPHSDSLLQGEAASNWRSELTGMETPPGPASVIGRAHLTDGDITAGISSGAGTALNTLQCSAVFALRGVSIEYIHKWIPES